MTAVNFDHDAHEAFDIAAAEAHPRSETAVGLDAGVERLVTTSDGWHFINVRPRSKRERDLWIAQRALARCKRSSKQRTKVRARVQRIQRDIAMSDQPICIASPGATG